MEYQDLYDKDGNKTGEIVLRTREKNNFPEDRFVKIVIIFIKNSEGKYLIQLTSKEKNSVMAATGGHVQAGQSSIEAIYAEVNEELGIDISHDDIKMLGSYTKQRALVDVYYLEKDIDIKDITLQVEEVESVNWYTVEEIKKFIEEGTFRTGNIEGFEMALEYSNRK